MKNEKEIDFDFDFDSFVKLFDMIDDSLMEQFLKFILIKDKMCDNDKQMIEMFIENDKKTNFIRVKYLFMLQFVISLGYFTDKLNDYVILKISSAGLSIYFRKNITINYRVYDKKTIINLENMCFKKFNKNIKNVILKNIEINDINK